MAATTDLGDGEDNREKGEFSGAQEEEESAKEMVMEVEASLIVCKVARRTKRDLLGAGGGFDGA